MKTFALPIAVMACASVGQTSLAELPTLLSGCAFHASFDQSSDADVAKGDPKIRTGDSLKREKVEAGIATDAVRWRKSGGRVGGALEFVRKCDELIFFKGGKNVPFSETKFAGTVSLWMKLDPKEDLPKGYVDPLQITDKKWNDASFFVDFDQGDARDFRLGVFSDFAFWNPKKRDFDDIPAEERPMVTVKSPPFSRDKWTHVVFTWEQFNDSDAPAVARLYMDGRLQGEIKGEQRFTWQPKDAVIMLGINYVGWMDEVSIFDRALSAKEVTTLGKSVSK